MDQKFWDKIDSFGQNGEYDKIVREITKCFPSSIKSTAGSLSFVPIKLAIFLITIPLAILNLPRLKSRGSKIFKNI